jgi:NAD-dependent SIR2 family protein deacetylase
MPIHIPVWAQGVRRLVVLSGAGVSTDSGIGDFRAASGAWTLNPAAQHRNTYRGFLADPELRAGYWRSRHEHPWHAAPNPGHFAVAALANSGIDTTVVTQNTDGLHQRAATPPDRVVELHGTMHVVICVECQHRSPTSEVIARIAAGEPVPQCLQCGGILKTASTMFGQTMPPAVFARAEQAVLDCDLLLAVGTTLTVEPEGSLCATAVRAGAALVIANWDPTPYDGIATQIIRDSLSESLPRIAEQLLAGAARAGARPVLPCAAADPASLARHTDPQDNPGALQASVLAALLGPTEPAPDTLISNELAHLHRASAEHGLALSADAVAAAATTVILCGAADEEAAVASLSHLAELEDVDIRIRTARWLRDMYPPAVAGPSPYWDDSLPAALAEELLASVVTPRFLLRMLTATTEEQDRRTLTVLARAAATRPGLGTCLVELLSVLPGLCPAAVDAALTGGYPAPLAAALVSLARNAALPAELLEAIPAGTTVLGEFPVLLAGSLVEAYAARVARYPDSAPRGLVRMLIELAGRLADLGRADQALAAAQRAVEVAGGLAEELDFPARAAASLRRAQKLARREH